MKRLIKSLNANDLRKIGSFDMHVIHEHFSLTDIAFDGQAMYFDIPGVTMVFDLAGSSASIRQEGPQAFVDRYATIFNDLTRIIYSGGGVVEKFPGDGISAHFIVKPGEDISHSRINAATAAYKIKKYMESNGLNGQFRICMWSGPDTIATLIGNETHTELISVGHGVNVAHKLEKHVKMAGCVIGSDISIAVKYDKIAGVNTRAWGLPEDLRSKPDEKWYGV